LKKKMKCSIKKNSKISKKNDFEKLLKIEIRDFVQVRKLQFV